MPTPAMQLPAGERSRATAVPLPLLACIGALLAVMLPVLAHRFPPLVDLPNHIARHHIATTAGGPLSEYYTYRATLVPNSSADLLWELLGMPGDPATFSRLVMASAAGLLVAAAMSLGRVLQGRWTVWPAATAALAYNANFLWGFENYSLSAPFALFGLAGWIASDRLATWQRLALFVPVSLVLYLMHFFAFGALALMAFGHEAQRLIETPRGQRLRQSGTMALMALPFLVPLLWQAIASIRAPGPGDGFTRLPDLTERLAAFVSPFSSVNATADLPFEVTGALGMGLMIAAFVTLLRRQGPRLRLMRRAWGPVVVLATAAILAPAWVNGVALVHIRLPFLLATVMVAGSVWEGLGRRQARLVAGLVIALIAARGLAFERLAARHSAEIAQMVALLDVVPPGARLLPLRAPGMILDRRLWHAQAYAVTYRDAFVPTLFQGVHAIELLPRWQAYASPAMFAPDIASLLAGDLGVPFYSDWQHKFGYALLLDDDRAMVDAQPELHEIAHSGRFTLYRITPR